MPADWFARLEGRGNGGHRGGSDAGALSLRPEQGALIPGGAGLRKLRWGAEGRGKRGGVRTIYYWAVDDDLCYMVYMYAKNEQGDLSPTQIRALARVVREEFT